MHDTVCDDVLGCSYGRAPQRIIELQHHQGVERSDFVSAETNAALTLSLSQSSLSTELIVNQSHENLQR